MTLYKRNEIWWIKYQHNNKLVRVSTGLREKRKANAVLNNMKLAMTRTLECDKICDMIRGIYGESVAIKNVLKISDAWDKYVELAKTIGKLNIGEDTLRRRNRRFGKLVTWLAKRYPAVETVDAITPVIAAAFATSLADDGQSEKTRINILSDLSTIWVILEHAADGIRNPWLGLRPKNTSTNHGSPFSRTEEARVLAAAKEVGRGWYEACMIARHTGLRYGDVATLQWSSINLMHKIIRIEPRKTARHAIAVKIPINDALFPVIAHMVIAGHNSSYVLPNHAALYEESNGHKYLPFAEVLTAAGLDSGKFTFHSWRHTFRTRLAEAGVSKDVAMRLCGHTVESTSEIYDHSDHIDDLREAVAAAK